MRVIYMLLVAAAISHNCKGQVNDTTAYVPDTLQAVTVSSKTPLVTKKIDRIVYDVQGDPQSKVSNVLEIMHKVPYLSVDGNDNILMNGSSGYRVFINGRPSGLVESNPKDVLRSIPASTIRSIEVITNPPAKYDAEGLAGIINIVTIRQVFDGYKASLNIYEKAPVGGPVAGGSMTSKLGRLGISVIGGGNKQLQPETWSRMERDGLTSQPTTLRQYDTRRSDSYTVYAGLGLSYEADSLNLIAAEASWHKVIAERSFAQVSSLTGANLQQVYHISAASATEKEGADVTISYEKGFRASKAQLLSFSYRYMQYGNTLSNDVTLFNEINYSLPDYRQHNAETLSDHTAQVDYEQPIGKLVVEGGIKGIFRQHATDFQYRTLNAANGEYEMEDMRSNNFRNRRDIVGLYNSYTYSSGNWLLKVGVRAEQTMITIDYSHGNVPWQQYLNVLPSGFISRKFKNNSSLEFSFTKRIQRPTPSELNPFVDYSNPSLESGGNPYLRPITSDVYQLSYFTSGKTSFNIAVCAMFFNHVFSAIPAYDASTNITHVRFENYGQGRVLKTNFYMNHQVTEQWNIAANSDIRHVAVFGTSDSISMQNSGFNVFLNLASGYSFKKGWQLNTALTYQMGGISLPMGNTNGFVATSFSASKSFLQSKLSVSVAANNPFTRYRYMRETIIGRDFRQSSASQLYYRQFTISLNYRFGKLAEETRKNRRSIDSNEIGS